ncbi:ABC transporter [Acidisphaera rubrifaciens HS-AP3]|uniref:ABC transporter n=1 Tax=Acidisphaera rubrifaciens HS-AP3 TaxID=1231350 RepID=A0A0D6P9F1_9PROT|nr:ABC transporter [Acidisphaera rubrifaciens HS-AP3]
MAGSGSVGRAGRLLAAIVLGLVCTKVARADGMKAAMLLPGSINDQSWNALGYSGLMKIKSLGIATAYSENVPDSDDTASMEDYARQGYGIILGHSGRFLSAAEQVGPDYPKVQFIIGGGAGGQAPNVMSIDFNNAEFGCQIGVLAARMSKTGKVGGVYGLEGLPNIVAQAGAFRLCARKARPDITVTIIYIKDMEDAASGKEAALSLIANGADVLTGKLNAAMNGVIAAAKEKGVYATARSVDSIATAPKQVLTALVEHWGDMYGAAAADAKAGHLSGSFVQYGYATADRTTGANFVYGSGEFSPAVPKPVVDELMAMQKTFAAGGMKITPTREDARGGS